MRLQFALTSYHCMVPQMTVITPKFWVSPTWRYPTTLDNASKNCQHYCNLLGRKLDTHVICDAHFDVQSLRKAATTDDYPDAHLVIGFEDEDKLIINAQRLRDEWFNAMGFAIIKVAAYDDNLYDGEYCFWNHQEYRSMHGCSHKKKCRGGRGCLFRHNQIKLENRNFKLPE